MKIVYGLLSFLLVLKAIGSFFTFFKALIENRPLESMVIFNAVFGLAVFIYFGFIAYKANLKRVSTNQELDK
ncbi:MAG: hypothetical protein EOP00_34900 [Pedobacter sp.]|nr:MAG: hypothetical protein EOP00_34900 [Pedobacter sp.]